MKPITSTLVFVVIFVISAHGQGFGNLDFESAQNLPGNPGSGVLMAVTNALPGWTAYDDSLALSEVYYVSNYSGASSSVELEGGSLALSGNFSVGLYLEGSITQTGLVPDNAESLQFEAYVPSASGFTVTLGGLNLSYSVLSVGSGYDVYGANIPPDLDGQTEALTFLVQNVTPGVLLDNIDFSPASVPEPAEVALIGIGVVLFGVSRLRARLPPSPGLGATSRRGTGKGF